MTLTDKAEEQLARHPAASDWRRAVAPGSAQLPPGRPGKRQKAARVCGALLGVSSCRHALSVLALDQHVPVGHLLWQRL